MVLVRLEFFNMFSCLVLMTHDVYNLTKTSQQMLQYSSGSGGQRGEAGRGQSLHDLCAGHNWGRGLAPLSLALSRPTPGVWGNLLPS